MFNLFKKKKPGQLIGELLEVDMHAHMAPGIDDGAADLEAAFNIVKGLTDLGYKKLIATPHVYWDLYKNTRQTIEPAVTALNKHLETVLPGVEVAFGAEYMMDEHFTEMVKQKEPLLTVKDQMVLVELPFTFLPKGWRECLFDLQMNGYQPIMAHPERYGFAQENPELMHEMKDAGCLLQMNLISLTGYNGPAAKKAAHYLVKNELIAFGGSDAHHGKHLNAMADPVIVHQLAQYKGFLNSSLL